MTIANPACVLFLHKRLSDCDLSSFFDTFEPIVQLDDDVDLTSSLATDHLLDYVELLYLSPEVCQHVERATRGQSCNPLWMKVRKLLLTALNFGRICKLRETTDCAALLKTFCGYASIPKTKAMPHGLHTEGKAR